MRLLRARPRAAPRMRAGECRSLVQNCAQNCLELHDTSEIGHPHNWAPTHVREMSRGEASNAAIARNLARVDAALCAPGAFKQANGDRELEFRAVKVAFNRRALETHPDKTKGDDEEFLELLDA